MKVCPLLAAGLFILLSIQLKAQPRCYFDNIHQQKLLNDPQYRRNISSNEKNVLAYIEKNKKRLFSKVIASSTALYTIPVVVHIIHTGGAVGSIYNPTDAQIEGAINYLNQVYNGTYLGTSGAGNIEIQFVLPERAPDCATTTGINRINGSSLPNYVAEGVNADSIKGINHITLKNLSRWDPSEYYNIWIVNKIDGFDGTSGSFIAGFAAFPGSQPVVDGTVMLATQMVAGQKTLPHEIGHAFGLYHPFEEGFDNHGNIVCPPNNNPFSDGDMVADTDPITIPIGFVCRSGINACNNQNYSSNTENNYMNYTNCYNLFTVGQKARMLAFVESIFRKSLSTSPALNSSSTISLYSLPRAAKDIPVTAAIGLSNSYAGIINVSINNRNLYSSYVSIDKGYVDNTSSCIKLIPLIRGNSYNFTATVLGINDEQLHAWIDFNNDGIFANTERIHYNPFINHNRPYGYTTTTGSFTVPNDATINTVIRMRVMDDLQNFDTSSHNPEYGQAEDYAVLISPPTLPIILSSFNGNLSQDRVYLKWVTNSEVNAHYFDIEKSEDGNLFYKIGKVNAIGNSSLLNDYNFVDTRLEVFNYYRLRMVDKDRREDFSKTILIKKPSIIKNVWLTDPVIAQSIEINFTNQVKQVQLELINDNGIALAKSEFQNRHGKLNWVLQNKVIAKGIYIVRATIDGEIHTWKVIKN